MSQKCTKCKIDKLLSEFYIRSKNGNYRKDCKECVGKRKKELRKKNTIKNQEKLKIIDKTQIRNCTICNKEKQLSEFSIKKDSKSGFYSWCLVCSRKKDNERRKLRKEYSIIDMKKCNKCNINKNVLKNFSKKLGSIDGYSNICKECNKEYRKNISKELYQKKKHRLNTNIQFKLSENIRARIRMLLCAKKISKPKTEMLIDCDLDNFIKHLKTSFYDQITFDNYGIIWQLDHIIPCNWFDLTDINQLKSCTHYTNLQALLIKDNTVKSNKLDWIHPKSGYQITFLRLIYNKFITIPDLTI
jgi:hypothetical protein